MRVKQVIYARTIMSVSRIVRYCAKVCVSIPGQIPFANNYWCLFNLLREPDVGFVAG